MTMAYTAFAYLKVSRAVITIRNVARRVVSGRNARPDGVGKLCNRTYSRKELNHV